MNEGNMNLGTHKSVVAMVKEDGKLKGIELRKVRDSLEILWARSAEASDTDWRSFASACGVSVGSAADAGAQSDRTVVVGFGSAGTVFHRASVPPVESREIESIMQLQAETRLPLPADQTELAWRADPAHNGQIGVTMLVARRQLLQKFAEDVRFLDPAKILLDCEAIVKTWASLFSEHEEKAIVVSMGRRSTQVCLAENRRLSNAVVLDMGIEDFSAPADDGRVETDDRVALDLAIETFALEPHTGQTEVTERFAQDMRSVVDMFGCGGRPELPVIVLSDDSAVYVGIVSALRSAGLNARIALAQTRKLTGPAEPDAESIYDYRAPIGLALMAIEDGADELNIFKHIYSPADTQQKQHWLYSPKIACAIASVMLLVLLIVWYTIDLKSPKSIETRLQASTAGTDTNLDALVARQKLIKTVARERPDVLALIKLVNESGERGVMLNSLSFKKNQKVTITGQVQSNEQLYKLHEKLRKHKDLADVEIQGTGKVSGAPSRGPSGGSPPKPDSGPPPAPGGPPSAGRSGPGARGRGGVTFTITFHYKNFTKKTRTAR